VAKESVIFTSGGTEANVLAVRGVGPGRIVIEGESHPSVFEAAEGITGKKTTLISSATTTNLLGRKIREERKKKNSQYPLLHIDASQTAAYFNVGLESLQCDLLTLDAAKLYGPKGIGALVVRRGVELALPPRGTPSAALIAGFACALEIAVRDRESERVRLSSLSERFAEKVRQDISQASVEILEPNIVHVLVPEVLPEFMILALDRSGVKASAGPACNSNKPESPDTPVRFSFGRFTTQKDIDEAAKIFCKEVGNLLK
jgi:cysteine desulfurase